MSKVRAHISVSLDGYVAGPNQSLENPLGERGEDLHEWLTSLKAWREAAGMKGGDENVSGAVVREANANVGAEIMGRGKFGPPKRGPWDDDAWQGWWGDHPPFHKPVFVVTHHAREPLTLADTTFTFVTEGVEAALVQAREAVGDKDVFIGGGADVINQYLAARPDGRDRAPHRASAPGWRSSPLRRRRRVHPARADPHHRGAGGDAPQVPRRQVTPQSHE
jgi:dihydrofolate reductase